MTTASGSMKAKAIPISSGRKVIFLLALIFLVLLAAEILNRAQLMVRGKTYRVSEIESEFRRHVSAMTSSVPVAGNERQGRQRVPALRRLHPYVGFLNRVKGFSEFQTDPDAASFSVWLVGGSVAYLCGDLLEQSIEERCGGFIAGLGKKLRFFNQGRGSYKQPQQLNFVAQLLSMGYLPDAVINLDGFNEVALGSFNLSVGVHPVYPSFPQWQALVEGRTTSRDARRYQFSLWNFERKARQIEKWVLKRKVHYSSIVGRFMLSRVAGVRKSWIEVQSKYMKYLFQFGGAEKLGLQYEGDPERGLDRCIDNWEQGSRSLAAICRDRSILYLHALQPTLHDPGAKIVSEKEKQQGHAPQSWIDGVRKGYPRLRERGRELAQFGLTFVDCSMLFSNVEETLYYDPCHFVDEGRRIVGEKIADALLNLLESR